MIAQFIEKVEKELLTNLLLVSEDDDEPIIIKQVPDDWKVLGVGNYAGVFYHADFSQLVVKVYAPNRDGFEDERQVYQMLGSHPAYSECFYSDKNYLILKRLNGVTLFKSVQRGIRIPEQVIRDVDDAIDYAKYRGLRPQDIHGKNVVMHNGRGYIVDVSDFLEDGTCEMWDDLKRAYFKFYKPLLYRYPIPIPFVVLNLIRKVYRRYRKLRGSGPN